MKSTERQARYRMSLYISDVAIKDTLTSYSDTTTPSILDTRRSGWPHPFARLDICHLTPRGIALPMPTYYTRHTWLFLGTSKEKQLIGTVNYNHGDVWNDALVIKTMAWQQHRPLGESNKSIIVRWEKYSAESGIPIILVDANSIMLVSKDRRSSK